MSHCVWWKASPPCEKGGPFLFEQPGATAVPALTSAAGVDELKDLFLAVYLEQLWSRAKPDFRSEKGWKNILDTFYESCENRLKDLHTSPDIFAFATKCFKDLDFKEKFVAQAVEICTRHTIPFEVQTSFVRATAETADFEKSAQAAAGLFNYSLASGNRSIDLESEEPASSSFQVALRPSDQVLDLE